MAIRRRTIPGYHFVRVGYPGLIVHSMPTYEGGSVGNPYMLLAAVDKTNLLRLGFPGMDDRPGKNPQEWLYVDLDHLLSGISGYDTPVFSLYISSTTYWMAADE